MWMRPVAGMTNTATPAIIRKPISTRLLGSSSNPSSLRPDFRRATSTLTKTTTGHPRPISNRFEPVMFAAAYWVYSGRWPAVYA